MEQQAASGNHDRRRRWTFLTNHGHVLLCIARDPDLKLSEISAHVGITERATQLILADLIESGHIARTKIGRRNHYQVNNDAPFRHPLFDNHDIGELIDVLVGQNSLREPTTQT